LIFLISNMKVRL